MEGDEFDLGRRNMLNYGHCLGHALETSSEYYIPHGIAINIGMIFSNYLSINRNLANKKDVAFINNKILIPYICLELRIGDFDEKLLLEAMKNDKKRVGKYLSVIIPDEKFSMIKIDDVTDDEFYNALNDTINLLFK
jgi:3-dehydroquinate synthase